MTVHALVAAIDTPSIAIHLVQPDSWPGVRYSLPASARAFAEAHGFEPKPGRYLALPDAKGTIAAVLFGIDPAESPRANPFLPGKLPGLLPDGTYHFATLPPGSAETATLAFLLGTYRFERYREPKEGGCRIVLPDGVDGDELARIVEAVTLGRDLINTPANDLGPDGIEEAIRALGTRFGAGVRTIVGDELLAHNLPMIHAVGRASAVPPRLIDLTWGAADAPKVTLVGKGVAFDTGGLDIKLSSAMLLMKKDMGGAAAAIALAQMIMDARLPVRLRLLVPAVENAVSGASFRPGDILRSRKGITVEIGNTDAEGRLILADALALADEEAPELLIDFATLTGAARVALGPDLPPLFTRDDSLAGELQRLGLAVWDPLWRLPLWGAYDSMLESKVAQVNNVSSGGFAGAITAALFLQRFVEKAAAYAHLDIYAWNPSTKPGRPEGGEVQGARALYAYLKGRYGSPA